MIDWILFVCAGLFVAICMGLLLFQMIRMAIALHAGERIIKSKEEVFKELRGPYGLWLLVLLILFGVMWILFMLRDVD